MPLSREFSWSAPVLVARPREPWRSWQASARRPSSRSSVTWASRAPYRAGLGLRRELAAEPGERPTALAVAAAPHERVEIAPGAIEFAPGDAGNQAELERPGMQLLRLGIAGLESFQQLDHRRVVGRRRACSDRGAEESRPRDQRLIAAPRSGLTHERPEAGENPTPLLGRRLAGQLADTAFERSETGAARERPARDVTV